MSAGIGAYCRELLAREIGRDDEGHALGLGYRRILNMVRRRFPHSAADELHIRWYASQMRREGLMIPVHRERSRWK